MAVAALEAVWAVVAMVAAATVMDVMAREMVVAAMAVASLVVAVMVRGGPLLLRVRVVRVGLAQPGGTRRAPSRSLLGTF
mmetsp:Transcript_33761/g.111683  ORF Transcript_33761/g.111683 Transcript_33761/m.111683 type:complete len:80 (-) Transcript_33761:1-240(-)